MEQFPHLAFWQDLGNLVAVSNRKLAESIACGQGWVTNSLGLLNRQVCWDIGCQ
jgi:hypothetical protein